MNINRLGAIDVGSNSVKLLISDVVNYKGKIVNKKFTHTRIPLQLGDDTFSLGYITEAKKERLALLIQTFKSFLEISDTEDFRTCATSALREASNKKEIVDYVYALTNVEIEIITPQEEANFIFLNGIDDSFNSDTLYVLVDVGGGCTEIALSKGGSLIESESFNLGTIRGLNRNQGIEEWRKIKKWLEEKRGNQRNVCMVGTGGNINKINSVFRKGGYIKRLHLRNYYRQLKEMDMDERIVKSDLGLNRAGVIMPAIDIYLSIMKILKIETLQIPMIGIADGIIKDIYQRKHL